jgi:hypothetical protein
MTSKKNFSMLIDANYRNKKNYPLLTNFDVLVNNTTDTDSYVEVPIFYWQWYSNQKYVEGTILGGDIQNILLSNNFKQTQYNYYIGCLLSLYDDTSQLLESSKIIKYNNLTNVVTVEILFLPTNFENCSSIKIFYPDSQENPYMCQICGYNIENIFEYTDLYLYNTSRQSIYFIKKISFYGLCQLIRPMLDYHLNDYLEIRSSNFFLQYQLYNSYKSIILYTLNENNDYKYKINMQVYINSFQLSYTKQIYKITNVNSIGQILNMEVVSYGGPYIVGEICSIIPVNENEMNDNHATLFVRSISTVIETLPNQFIPNNQENVLYFVKNDSIIYNYTIDKNYIILEYSILNELENENNINPIYYGFLRKINITCNMNVSNSSFPQNQLCYHIKINSLILPNLYVKGYNELLSFFPYVIVKIYNTNAPINSKYGNMITNDKHSMNSQFICPIGNLLNPEIIKFVEIKSDMEQTLKFDPSKDIHFEIRLPNGELLEFQDIYNIEIENLINLYDYTVKKTIACILNIQY